MIRFQKADLARAAAVILFIVVSGQTPLGALDDTGSLRCDRETIMTGDTRFQVRTACGDPYSVHVKGSNREVWIYNFGPTQFVYYLSFIRGRLERIQVGGYGDYHPDRLVD